MASLNFAGNFGAVDVAIWLFAANIYAHACVFRHAPLHLAHVWPGGRIAVVMLSSSLVLREWIQCETKSGSNAATFKIMQWNVLADGRKMRKCWLNMCVCVCVCVCAM